MTEITAPESRFEKPAGGQGCLHEIGWIFSSAVLPMGSFTFYRRTVQKSVGNAVVFFLVFTLTLATLSTISIGTSMFSVIGDIQKAYADGNMPEIVIRNGIAEVDGLQPKILVDESTQATQPTFVAIDTTGEITGIDTRRYNQGVLLTRTELHILNQQGDYQTVPLSEINTMFETDPILINAGTVSQAWSMLSVVIVIVMFILLVLWHSIVRLMFIAMAALVVWGIVSLLKPNTGFGPIIITGLYAVVPAIYISRLFSRSDLGLPGLQSLFLMIFWAAGLIAALMDIKALPDDQPARLWTAWIGTPMVILFIVDMFWQLPAPYGPVVLWVVAFLTGVILIGLRLFLRFRKPNPGQPAI